MELRTRWLVVACAGLAIGCATRSMPVQPVLSPAQPESFGAEIFDGPIGHEIPLVPDHVAAVIAAAEAEFTAGQAEWQRARPSAARAHFDRAVESLLALPGGARSEPRLAAAFDDLLERISALELDGVRQGGALAEARSEPAAIDELLGETALERPLPAATTAETVAADLARAVPAIPIPAHAKVISYVGLFQGRLREFMQAGLDRGQPYLPMITRVFREEGVPLELVYVPLVESAFKPNALSRAGARGMWQFMLGTAREHDLEQTWFVDERSDPEKATVAAARYLKALHAKFDGDWHRALASYNAGPARLQTAARRAKSTDFWIISATSRYLPRETREYVPMVLAAMLIGRSPELYGFQVGPAAPRVYETVTVPDSVGLATIAEWAEVPIDELRALNPELRRPITPASSHVLRVPVGTAPTIESRLASFTEFLKFRFHQVKAGESLTSIARKYGFSVRQLRDANDLTSSRVTRNQQIRIPDRPAAGSASALQTPSGTGSSTSTQIYRVKAGDTLFSIARQFETTVDVLKRLNQLSGDTIRVGDRLTVRR